MKMYVKPRIRYAELATESIIASSPTIERKEENIDNINDVLIREEQNTWEIKW